MLSLNISQFSKIYLKNHNIKEVLEAKLHGLISLAEEARLEAGIKEWESVDRIDEHDYICLLRSLYQGNYFNHIAIKLLSFINIDDRP